MKKLSAEKLQSIIESHGKWLNNEVGGCRADLCDADLRRADLRGADLRGADLCGADLRGADLCGADLDFSCLPLWCGSLKMTVDKRIAVQIAYHFCRLVCDDEEVKEAQQSLKVLANQFHRVEECGEIK